MSKFRQQIDVQVPFFHPLWRRVAAVAAAIGMVGFEVFVTGSVLWASIFGVAGAYLFHQFFIAWTPPGEDADDDKGEGAGT